MLSSSFADPRRGGCHCIPVHVQSLRQTALQRARFSKMSFATGRAENTLGQPV